MNPNRYRRKLLELRAVVFCAACCCVLGATCLRAQGQGKSADGDTERLCGVVRVSWRLVEALGEDRYRRCLVEAEERFQDAEALKAQRRLTIPFVRQVLGLNRQNPA